MSDAQIITVFLCSETRRRVACVKGSIAETRKECEVCHIKQERMSCRVDDVGNTVVAEEHAVASIKAQIDRALATKSS